MSARVARAFAERPQGASGAPSVSAQPAPRAVEPSASGQRSMPSWRRTHWSALPEAYPLAANRMPGRTRTHWSGTPARNGRCRATRWASERQRQRRRAGRATHHHLTHLRCGKTHLCISRMVSRPMSSSAPTMCEGLEAGDKCNGERPGLQI